MTDLEINTACSDLFPRLIFSGIHDLGVKLTPDEVKLVVAIIDEAVKTWGKNMNGGENDTLRS